MICSSLVVFRVETIMKRTRISAAVLAVLCLSGCTIGPTWTTLESNLTDSFVDKRLTTLGMFSNDVKMSERAFLKYLTEDLEKAGYLRSNASLHEYLSSVGMDCSAKASVKQSCRLSRHKVEWLDSGGPEDGVARIDWHVTIAWNNDGTPIKPSIAMDRTIKRVSNS
jgi:hypothetical protein